jgi:hypothetical protein
MKMVDINLWSFAVINFFIIFRILFDMTILFRYIILLTYNIFSLYFFLLIDVLILLRISFFLLFYFLNFLKLFYRRRSAIFILFSLHSIMWSSWSTTLFFILEILLLGMSLLLNRLSLLSGNISYNRIINYRLRL